MKTLIIVDMQNDFIDGSLANPAAQKIVGPICEYVKKTKMNYDFKNIILTRDTHQIDYLDTPEGEALPIEHCIEGTGGFCVADDIQKVLRHEVIYTYINKPTFGFTGWEKYEDLLADEIEIVGTCTDICVISNALILKAMFPNKKITVLKDLCAGLTPEKHEAALEIMKSCQIEVR